MSRIKRPQVHVDFCAAMRSRQYEPAQAKNKSKTTTFDIRRFYQADSFAAHTPVTPKYTKVHPGPLPSNLPADLIKNDNSKSRQAIDLLIGALKDQFPGSSPAAQSVLEGLKTIADAIHASKNKALNTQGLSNQFFKLSRACIQLAASHGDQGIKWAVSAAQKLEQIFGGQISAFRTIDTMSRAFLGKTLSGQPCKVEERIVALQNLPKEISGMGESPMPFLSRIQSELSRLLATPWLGAGTSVR